MGLEDDVHFEKTPLSLLASGHGVKRDSWEAILVLTQMETHRVIPGDGWPGAEISKTGPGIGEDTMLSLSEGTLGKDQGQLPLSGLSRR